MRRTKTILALAGLLALCLPQAQAESAAAPRSCKEHSKSAQRSQAGCAKAPIVRAKARPETTRVPPRQVSRVYGNPDGALRIVLRKKATRPKLGSPFVIPVSEVVPSGVLGIVTEVRRSPNGRLRVTTRPAALDEAYAQFKVRLEDATLGELGATATTTAQASASKLFTCTDSGPAAKLDVDSDFSKLKPQFELDIGRPEIFFMLSGTAKLGVELSSKAGASCKYTGNAKIVIPIAGTPVVITIKPAINGSLSGEIASEFSWSPRIAVGAQKGPGVDQSFHSLSKGTVSPPSFHGSGKARLFLGVNVAVSVAERAGVEGSAGPQLEAKVEARDDSVCLGADASLHAELNAFADVFVKRWTFSIAKGDFGKLELLSACSRDASPSPGGGSGPPRRPPVPRYSTGGAADRSSLTHLSGCDNGSMAPGGALSADNQALFGTCSQMGVFSLPGNSFSPLASWPPGGFAACCYYPGAISGDGRFLAISGSEIVESKPGSPTVTSPSAYLYDRNGSSSERLDVPAPGGSGTCLENRFPGPPVAISDDGSVAALMTCARLSPGDQNKIVETYVRDRSAGTTTRMPTECATEYWPVKVSGDGRFVGYTGCTLGRSEVCNGPHTFLFDRATSSQLDASPECGVLLDISTDGRYVLSSGYSFAHKIYALTLFDRLTGNADVIAETIGYVTTGTISDNGRYIAYFEQPAHDGHGYRLDRGTLRRSRLDVSQTDTLADCQGFFKAEISRDGRTVAFETCGSLVPGDTDTTPDLYLARYP